MLHRRTGRVIAMQFLYQCETLQAYDPERLPEFWQVWEDVVFPSPGNWEEWGAIIREEEKGWSHWGDIPLLARKARRFAAHLVWGVLDHRETIDAAIAAASLHWSLHRMARVDRNVLRVATYELLHEKETPRRVVINEAIEIGKRFGTSDSAAFINAILDRIAQEFPAEVPEEG